MFKSSFHSFTTPAIRLPQDPPPTLATLVGALSHTGNSGAAQAARAAFQPEEWSKLWPPGKQELRAHGKPAWLPGWNIAESLDPAELLQNAVPLDIRCALPLHASPIPPHMALGGLGFM